MHEILINLSIVFSRPTGISNYATNLFPYLKTLEPTLLAAQKYPEFNCYAVPGNLTPAQGSRGHFNRLLWTQLQLPKIYGQLKSQLVFSPIPEAPLYSNCRYIIMIHDLIPIRFPNKFSPLTAYFRYYIPPVLEQAQHIICNSQSTARDITDFYHISPAKVTPILLAHDANHFRPHKVEMKQRPYFLYLGRQDPYKNLHRLITAFAKLPNCDDYELWLVGAVDKRYTPQLQLQVAQLGITPQVKFLNYVPYRDLPHIINQATALVFPSLWEGFGFPVLEAMACGTPVITSNLSSLPEVAGDAAILINPYSIGEITEAMDVIATDTQLCDRLSLAGINRAKQFSWSKTGEATKEILSSYL